MKTITLDGVEYVEKSALQKERNAIQPSEGEQYCMVRTYSAGVFCGWIDPAKTIHQSNCVRDAKRIHYWDKAASLSELAIKGTAAPEECRVPLPMDLVYLQRIIEVIPMTEAAINTIEKIPVWTMHK